MNGLLLRTVKVFDIGYVTAIYFLLAFVISLSIDRVLGRFDTDKADKTSTPVLMLGAVANLWCVGVLAYLARNVVELIPSPLDGVHGFRHAWLGELRGASVFTVTTLVFQKNLSARLTYIYKRVNPGVL